MKKATTEESAREPAAAVGNNDIVKEEATTEEPVREPAAAAGNNDIVNEEATTEDPVREPNTTTGNNDLMEKSAEKTADNMDEGSIGVEQPTGRVEYEPDEMERSSADTGREIISEPVPASEENTANVSFDEAVSQAAEETQRQVGIGTQNRDSDVVKDGQMIEDQKGNLYCITSTQKRTAEYVLCPADCTSVSIPDSMIVDGISYSVVSIDEGAFEGNRKLKKVAIGKNVRMIGESVFSNCKNLKSVTMGENVSSIGNKAFGYLLTRG